MANTINVSVTKEQEMLVRKAVEFGLYRSNSEVLREALRRFNLELSAEIAKLEVILAAKEAAKRDIAAGNVHSASAAAAYFEEIIASFQTNE